MKQRVVSAIRMLQPRPLLLPVLALQSVISKTGRGVYASSDTLFGGAIFGRDSLEVAEDLLRLRARLVKQIILTLASLQGEENRDVNEEEPGKIVHEYRAAVVDGKPIGGVSREIFGEMSAKYGGDGQEMVYYGSVDATPLFVRLVGTYCARYGARLLDARIYLRSGHRLTMRLVTQNALSWIESSLERSQAGLLEYQRCNPKSFLNHVWKDSNEFYIHEDGQQVNHARPVSSIEVQGIVYDALMAGAELFPNRADELRDKAMALRDRVIELLWLPERNYFALGTDHDETDHLREITTTTANPAELLDTGIFDGLPDDQRRRYVEAITRTVFSRDFLTDAGVRSRALHEGRLVAFWDYHGSYTTWPKETHDIARGLRRQGMPLLARELENRLLNAVMKSGSYPEFFYVDEWGRVLATSPASADHADVVVIRGTNQPERVQAWTVSAIMETLNHRTPLPFSRRPKHHPRREYVAFENGLLAQIPRVERLRGWGLRARYPTYHYQLAPNDAGERIKGS